MSFNLISISAHFGVPHGIACAFTMPAVLRHNLKGEDGRFSQAAVALTGKNNIAGLVDCFNKLNSTLKVCDLVKNYIPSFEDLLRLQGEMITPGRADNLVNITSLVELLYEARCRNSILNGD